MVMNEKIWADVDRYYCEKLIPADTALDAALADSAKAGLPAIHVSPNQGKFLHLLARMQNARRILEIGTLGGYSTIWMARALPLGGSLLTLEADARHAEVARVNIARAGLAGVVELRVGRAADTLAALVAAREEPFDFIFVDADKSGLPDYFDFALKLSRMGTAIVFDNVVREGEVIRADSTDSSVRGVRQLNEKLSASRRVSATVVQSVGVKGYDGFSLALVTG